ncbi:MAG: N-acetylmuramoyl-L-alanine amidase [Caulobacteraceae bacterium]|jgi:N-acetylmuramoyl-L-alanine amidase|nr:N-acetylmuramoyl-L-alanine amidase [Caulobacteraceae bacterium]
MDVTRRAFAFFGATAVGSVAMGGRAFADVPSSIHGVLVQDAGAACRVTLALDRPAQARTFFLSEPSRFVIDIANAQLALPGGASGQGPGAGVVRRYRYAPQANGISRIVLDLEAPAQLVRQETGGRRNAALSFDIAASAPFTPAPAPAPLQRQGRQGRRTIVIDAGHGGRDPGAVGVSGTREKDVVLHTALMARDALEHRGYRVALTRDADNFVELENRVRFAREQHADLFISVHADASPNHDTTGASVYTLSDSGANRAQNMMASQNWDLDLGDTRNSLARDILVDLAQRDTTNRSAQFAQLVIPKLGEVAPLVRNTHRNAGFFVLLAPDVPAVLIETGFLSNATDERRLGDPRARERMADAVAQAVDAYFAPAAMYAAAD